MSLLKFALVVFCFLPLSSFAQQASLEKIENAYASKYKAFTVEPETKKKYSVSTHIKFIRVVDGRSDQTKLGITRAGEVVEDRRFIFPKEFNSYLQQKLNRLCDQDSEAKDTAVFLIRNLWLYQTLEPGSFFKQQALGVSNNWISNCFLNIDCFIVKHNLYSWYCTIDTVMTSRGWLPHQCNDNLTQSFSSAISYSDSMFVNHAPFTSISEEDFKNKIQSRFQYPILTAQKFTTGVFQTYADFLDNKVYPTDIEVNYQKNKRLIKSKTLADSVVSKSWGYSDGENLFMDVSGAFYKLIRVGNTFDLMGPRVVEYRTSLFNKLVEVAALSYGTAPIIDPLPLADPSHRTVESFKLYQLNINDGVFR